MKIKLDNILNETHLETIQSEFKTKGIPGRLEITDDFLEIIPPVYADPNSLEIIRPVIENLLKEISFKIKSEINH